MSSAAAAAVDKENKIIMSNLEKLQIAEATKQKLFNELIVKIVTDSWFRMSGSVKLRHDSGYPGLGSVPKWCKYHKKKYKSKL